LQSHFDACAGPYRAFTFIDPAENMLVSSSDFTTPAWQKSSLIHFVPGATGPDGAAGAVTVINTGQSNQEISQSFHVPANYQYCFSLYARSDSSSQLTLIRRGGSANESIGFPVEAAWSRIVSSGRLNDSGTVFAVAISLAPGQQVGIYGVQLEAQTAPSRYRPTQQIGGVYSRAHWGMDQLTVAATGPNLFSTSFTIEVVT
jgi:hypothetical protein